MSFLSKVTGLDTVKGLWNDFTGKTAVDQQNAYNMQMWKMQQEYNTPANQMARYREAGLNPNLVYGGSGQMAGNATSAPEMTAHQGSAAKAIGLMETLVGLKGQLESQQIEKVKTAADITHSQEVLDLESKKLVLDSIFRENDFNLRKSNADRDYELRKAAQIFQKEKHDWEKNYIETHGSKPGSTMGFASYLLGGLLGKPTTDVLTDTNKLMTNVWSFLLHVSPIGYLLTHSPEIGYGVKKTAASGSKVVSSLGPGMSKVRY